MKEMKYRDLVDEVIEETDEFKSRNSDCDSWRSVIESIGLKASDYKHVQFRRPIANTLKIELWKSYRTRDGRKARVICVDAHELFPIVALVGENKDTFTFAVDGSNHHPEAPMPCDLIAPWIDKPVVNWDAMPAWAKWVAMDEDGSWYNFEAKPATKNCGFGSTTYCAKIHPNFAPTLSGSWKDSLVERDIKAKGEK